MILLNSNFNFHIDLSGVVCMMLSILAMFIGAIGCGVGLLMRRYYLEMNRQRLPLSKAVITGSLIPTLAAGLSMIITLISIGTSGRSGQDFRETMDFFAVPGALITLLIGIVKIVQAAKAAKEFPTPEPKIDPEARNIIV